MQIKNIELYKRYKEYVWEKPKRPTFRERVLKYWYTKREAIDPKRDIRRSKRNKHIKRDEKGRVCNSCNEYKEREEYSYNKVWFHQRNGTCKKCKNQFHQEYRNKGGREKDKEYKEKKRKLNIWEQVYFNNEIREVQGYQYKKWYTVKSIINGTERRLDTNDNTIGVNRNCVRFSKLKEKITINQETDFYSLTEE